MNMMKEGKRSHESDGNGGGRSNGSDGNGGRERSNKFDWRKTEFIRI